MSDDTEDDWNTVSFTVDFGPGCPNCGSQNVDRTGEEKRGNTLEGFVAGDPGWVIEPVKWTKAGCGDCGHVWIPETTNPPKRV